MLEIMYRIERKIKYRFEAINSNANVSGVVQSLQNGLKCSCQHMTTRDMNRSCTYRNTVNYSLIVWQNISANKASAID